MSGTPSYRGLEPRSEAASAAARGSSRKAHTAPELLLRQGLWHGGLRYQLHRADLPGTPDIVFATRRLAVFVDGDFWHGRGWATRRAKLALGHNGAYWTSKIARNMERDRENDRALQAMGWRVLRVWESNIHGDLDAVVQRVETALR